MILRQKLLKIYNLINEYNNSNNLMSYNNIADELSKILELINNDKVYTEYELDKLNNILNHLDLYLFQSDIFDQYTKYCIELYIMLRVI